MPTLTTRYGSQLFGVDVLWDDSTANKLTATLTANYYSRMLISQTGNTDKGWETTSVSWAQGFSLGVIFQNPDSSATPQFDGMMCEFDLSVADSSGF